MQSLSAPTKPGAFSARPLFGLKGIPSASHRLVEDEERRWTDENIDMVALKHFPNIDKEKAMSRPILYSNWLSKVTNTSFQKYFFCHLSQSLFLTKNTFFLKHL